MEKKVKPDNCYSGGLCDINAKFPCEKKLGIDETIESCQVPRLTIGQIRLHSCLHFFGLQCSFATMAILVSFSSAIAGIAGFNFRSNPKKDLVFATVSY